MKNLKTYNQLFEKLLVSFEYLEICDLDSIKKIIKQHYINIIDINKDTLLIHIIRLLKKKITEIERKKIVIYLIENDIDVNIVNRTKDNALSWCAYFNYYEISKILIDNKINIDNRDNTKMTPLITASAEGNYETVELLIENGADINAVCKFGRSSLHYVTKNMIYSSENFKKTLFLLLDSDIDWNLEDENGETFLDYIYGDLRKKIKREYTKKYKQYEIKLKTKDFNL